MRPDHLVSWARSPTCHRSSSTAAPTSRSDIFAFRRGVVRDAHGPQGVRQRDHVPAIVIGAMVQTDPPPVSSLRPKVSRALDRAVRRCLAKGSRRPVAVRGRSAPTRPTIDREPARCPVNNHGPHLPIAAACPCWRRWSRSLTVALLAALLSCGRRGGRAAAPTIATPRRAPRSSRPAPGIPPSFALSPDGRQIVFVAASDTGSAPLAAIPVERRRRSPWPAPKGPLPPFWSPDSRSVGFFAANALKRLDLGGGAPQTLAPIRASRGGTWNADGVIVFAPNTVGPLMRISATGGDAAAATTLGPQQNASPAGRTHSPTAGRFLYCACRARPTRAGVYSGCPSMAAPRPGSRRASDSAGAVHARPVRGSTEAFRAGGWLLWVRSGSLVAQRLDVEHAKLTGEPIAAGRRGGGRPSFAAPQSRWLLAGAIAYRR